MKVVILGGGLAGLISLAHLRKKNEVILLEKDNYGGMLKTNRIKGYQFDLTGHLIHSLNREFEEFLKQTDIKIKKIKREAAIYFQNKYIPYPFQLNIKYLSPKIKNKIIDEILKLPDSNTGNNFIDWIQGIFGKTMTELFFIPYNEKLLQIDLKTISPSWYLRYMPIVDKIEIIRSLKHDRDIGYNNYFYYPAVGNIQIIVDKMYQLLADWVKLNTNIEKIDIESKVVYTNEKKYHYDLLISTIPYKQFLELAKVPYDYKVDYVNVMDLNIGLKKMNFPYHWVYFPEKKYSFYRIGSFSNICKNTVPNGKSSLYVEISFRKNTIDQDKIIEELEELGILNREDIEVIEKNIIEYAYPLYHLDVEKLRNHQQMLKEKNVLFWGRAGSHSYVSMADLFSFKLKNN